LTSDRAIQPVGLGVVGLGRGFMLMIPTFNADPRVRLVAAAAPRTESRAAFEAEFGGRSYDDILPLCADPEVEAVYVATPHQMHADHVCTALAAGKHVLVDKPIAVSLADADRMVAAAAESRKHLIVGPSHSFDPPVEAAARLIAGGEIGALRMIQAFNYTDFLYRPRRPEELQTDAGGGILFSQAIHQIDVVRRLAGEPATRVTAMTGAWDPARPTEGAFSALIAFASGAFASLTYSGYAHFDSDIWMDGIGELGQRKYPADYGKARRTLQGLDSQAEAALKQGRTYGSGSRLIRAESNEHFGPVIVLCDRADLRLLPGGLDVFGDTERRLVEVPFDQAPRRPVIDALVGAVREDRAPAQTGAWGRASLEICHAILESAASGQPVDLRRQQGNTQRRNT
jgi:phthalate 4,5-cis-dihydrodiol dehydrogenase